MSIPYIIYGGISFYQRKEIKDFIAYLRLIVNPKDEEALKRVINYPVRGIGKTTIDKRGYPRWHRYQDGYRCDICYKRDMRKQNKID